MSTLGFDNYAEACKVYLAKYRHVSFTRSALWTHLVLTLAPSFSTSMSISLAACIREMYLHRETTIRTEPPMKDPPWKR
jgi:hypothetical protein